MTNLLTAFKKFLTSIGYVILWPFYYVQEKVGALFKIVRNLFKRKKKRATKTKAKRKKPSFDFLKKLKKILGYLKLVWAKAVVKCITAVGATVTNLKFRKKASAKKTKVIAKKQTGLVKLTPKPQALPARKLPAWLKGWVLNLTLFFGGIFFATLFIFTPYEIQRWFKALPNPNLLVVKGSDKSTRILDRNGQLLYEIYVDRNYNPVKLDQIPPLMQDATIAVEDSEFYRHIGVRPESIVRAAKETFLNQNIQGGSTITQQLVKNVLLTPEQTFSRKIKEAVLAILVETRYSKSQILEMYLNNIPYGGTAWGVQSAAQKYFGKNVWELDLAQESMLAGLPSAPTSYSPITDLPMAKDRQKFVLTKMAEQHYITQEEADAAYAEDLQFAEDKVYIRAPHFVDFVRNELEKKYGKRFVDMGGLTVTTSLDLTLQDQVQQIVVDEVNKDAYLNISNGAAVVLDAKDATILAYVGSVDYFKPGWGAYDVASAMRQPGSSIKPVTYALALADGYTPASILKDTPVTFQSNGAESYTPVNYDGRFHGNVTLRSALANSYNIPAVRLAAALGPDNIVEFGKEMGLTNWQVDGSYGISVTLGGKEVRLVDLANTYGTLARGGVYKELSPILSIKDANGFDIYDVNARTSQRVFSSEVAYLMWTILSDTNARLPEFGPNNYLSLPDYHVAAKTGTTDNKRDNWTFGYTPSYVVGVWVGNNDNTPMNPYLASGLSGAAPMWNRIFATTLQGKADEVPTMPDGVFVKTDFACGASEYFIKGTTVPASLCGEKEKPTPSPISSKSEKKKH